MRFLPELAGALVAFYLVAICVLIHVKHRTLRKLARLWE